MDSIVAELFDIYDQLRNFVEEVNDNRSIESLLLLEEVATEVGKSWSGSWFGYQSRVYYKDFNPTPAGAHFSSEWGLIQNLLLDTRGDWNEFEFDVVVDYIRTRAKQPDVVRARKFANFGQELFNEKRNTVLSIIETSQSHKRDSFVDTLSERIKNLKIFNESDWINSAHPTGSVWSRDTLALSQGIQTPPHMSILAEVFAIRSPIFACENLAKEIKVLGSHLERQAKRMDRLERVGTNIFIGHGRSLVWKELKDFIKDRLNLPFEEFNRVPIAGITNISRLSEMLDSAAFAFLVMTAEDEQIDGSMRARMNVIHEAGLFQGRLGFTRAIVVLEEGCEEFSNIHGLGQIRFPKGNIKATFEDIRQVLEREGIIE